MDEWTELRKFISNMALFQFIGTGTKSESEISDFVADQVMSISDDAKPFEFVSSVSSNEYLEKLFPLLKKNRGRSNYSIDMELLEKYIRDFVALFFPGKTLVDLSEVESSGQNYKYLYESIIKKNRELSEENANLVFKTIGLEKDVAQLTVENNFLKEGNSKFADSASVLMEFIRGFIDNEITVSDCKAVGRDGSPIVYKSDEHLIASKEDVSLKPGVYNGKRPSWFSPLQTELCRENVSEKMTRNTVSVLLDRLNFWRDVERSEKTPSEKADMVDNRRRDEIVKLLNSNLTNEEKYLKYILLTPGMSREYVKTINGCTELKIDANIIIKLLEQENDLYNHDIIEAYVSKAHKGLEHNYKQELAEELIRGEWYVSAVIEGRKVKFELIPYELISSIKDRFEEIYSALEKGHTDIVRADGSETDAEITDTGGFDVLWQKELENSFNDDDKAVPEENDIADDEDPEIQDQDFDDMDTSFINDAL